MQGFVKDGVYRFLGIPYAAPPVGQLRWQPPQPPENRVRPLDATQYRNSCPQSYTIAVFAGPTSVTEDCLYLNIFTTGIGDGRQRPVIVWIHGGGNFTGSSTDYDGSELARGGSRGTPAVVVTLNFRLGLLGFLAHPALMAEGPLFANYGTLDQQAALRWVQDNIAAFGGDPTRVTVAGQSGGSVSTHANVVSPLAKGLLNSAIFQSAPNAIFVTLDAAKARGEAFAAAAGCSGSNARVAQCLRNLSVARILQLQGTLKANGPYLDPGSQNVIVDGTIIPMQPTEAYASGNFNKVPVLGGTTRDELSFTLGIDEYFSGPPQRAITADEYVAVVNARYGVAAPIVLAQYPVSAYGGDPVTTYIRVLSDPVACGAGLAPLKNLSRLTPTYGYDFTYQNAPFPFPKMPGFRALAAHTIDIQFFFKGYHGGPLGVNLDQVTGMPRELNQSETQLSDQLIGFWTNFAKTGNPNAPGTSLWPALNPDSPVLLRQDIPLSTVTEAELRATYQCGFWDSLS